MKDQKLSGAEELVELVQKANLIINEVIPGIEESREPIILKLTPDGVLKGIGERRSFCNVLESKLVKLAPIQRDILNLLKKTGIEIPEECAFPKEKLEEILEIEREKYNRL